MKAARINSKADTRAGPSGLLTKAPGVATTAYSFALSDDERFEMARRITAALNLTKHLTVEQMEGAAPLVLRSNVKLTSGAAAESETKK